MLELTARIYPRYEILSRMSFATLEKQLTLATFVFPKTKASRPYVVIVAGLARALT